MTKNQELKDYILSKRPHLSVGSVTTYSSILRNIYKTVYPGDSEMDISKFDNASEILGHMQELPPSSRKTRLSALFVITGNSAYSTQMESDIHEYNTEIAKQEKTETQKENWIPYSEVETRLEQLKSDADLLYKKKKLTQTDLQNIQQYILLALMSGLYIAPRRSLDYCVFKIRGTIDRESDNFVDRGYMVFNRYKTSKYSGEQRIKIPTALGRILRKWFSVNQHDTLFSDVNGSALTSVTFNQRLNKIFGGRKISTNMLRHVYLTNKFADTIKQNEQIADTMESMGSSANMLENYVKR